MFRPLKPYQVVVDGSVAVAFALVALAYQAPGGWPVGDLNQIVPTLAMAVALGLRRLAPGRALGVAWLGAILQMLVGVPPMPANVAIFAVLYTTAAYGTRLVFWLGFASSFVGAVVITLYLVLRPSFGAGGVTWSTIPLALAVLVAAGFALLLSWTVGALVRTAMRARENRRAQEEAEAEAVVEQERVRIARDMHDVVAHSLAVVIAQADGARYAAAADPAVATEALGTISTTARAALADVRLLLAQLRHSQGDGPQPTLADLEELYAQVRAAGVELRIDVDPAPVGEPPAGVQLAVYRILQEALTNALRHGEPRGPVDVRLAWHPDRVDLEVRNPVPPGVEPGGGLGHGVIGMRERAQLAGGRLGAEHRGADFVVTAGLPIGAAE
ncbi:histidine kinase [Microbacterium sp. 2FI]|uniref:sensor histidine kinase n=1 Tax=Microbacterium sp. 2FI TaxID=2502193 RepID=UPI0010F64B05|nr:histidine kinase [Microbacterium sp. 2FI]